MEGGRDFETINDIGIINSSCCSFCEKMEEGLLNENSFESIHQVMHGDEHEFVQFNKQPSRKLVSMTKHQNVKALLDMDIT